MSQAAFHLVPYPPGDAPADNVDDPLEHEAELVERARSSADAFARLYRAHHPAIARYIRRRVGDEHVAGDLVAETFLAALSNLHRYRSRGLPFRAWLYRLATSRVNRWSRRRPARAPHAFDESEHASPSGDARDDALADLARRALFALPTKYQDTLALHYLEGLSVDAISTALGVRPGTVKARLARGRERLRRKLAPYAEGFLR